MADPVKISDLPAISSVQPNDILPVVDAALTQTSKCTASQIAAIGGGPPGDGTVTEAKLANGAVTAGKVGFTGPDKLISRTLNGSGAGVEIPCTSYARGLLAASNAAGARQYLDALQGTESPTFSGTVTINGDMSVSGGITGQVRAGDGTASAPSYSFSDDIDTGIASLGGNGSLSLVSNGDEKLRLFANGNLGLRVPTAAVAAADYPLGMFPAFACRAWIVFNGLAHTVSGSGNVSSLTDTGQGTHTIRFTVPMPDANYAFVLGCRDSTSGSAGTQAIINVNYAFARDNEKISVYTARRTDGVWIDVPEACVAIFR